MAITIGYRIDRAKGLFFETEKVRKSVDKATRKVLSKIGAFVRRTARSSIRKRKKISEIESPPSGHTGALKRSIFFVYNPSKHSVIIGPTELNKGTDAPRLLEAGGRVARRRRGQRIIATYKARPFMGPAWEKEQPKLPAMWRDSVR